MRRSLVAICCVIALLAGFFVIPSSAAPRPLMVFVSEYPTVNSYEFYSARILYSDGSVSEPVNPPSTYVYDPAWSPDGTRIAFTAIPIACLAVAGCKNDTRMALWVVAADGSTPTPIRVEDIDGYARGPQWSPDGKRLVYTRWPHDYVGDRGLMSDIWQVTEVAPGVWTNEPLLERRGQEVWPELSPDGERLLYSYLPDDDGIRRPSEGPMDFDLWVSDADGSGPHVRLTDMPGDIAWPNATWSPDGKSIAFAANWDLWIMKADGSGLRRLLKRMVFSFPDFSPDGRRIAFTNCRKWSFCRILSVAVSGPRDLKVEVDIPEQTDWMSDYFPLS